MRTPTRRSGRRSAVSEAKSTLPAVSPPTWAVRPVWRSTAGRVSCRSRSMSAAVCRSAGPHAGVTWTTAVVPDGLKRGAATEMTPGVRSREETRTGAAGPAGVAPGWAPADGAWATTVIGPTEPGPKPRTARS